MTRLATCNGGTRLVRCGDRVQLCGDTPGSSSCDALVILHECPSPLPSTPTDPPEVERLTPRVQVYEWTFSYYWEVEYPDGEVQILVDWASAGIFGFAFQWGRPPTDAEVRQTWGIDPAWTGATNWVSNGTPAGSAHEVALFRYGGITRNEAGSFPFNAQTNPVGCEVYSNTLRGSGPGSILYRNFVRTFSAEPPATPGDPVQCYSFDDGLTNNRWTVSVTRGGGEVESVYTRSSASSYDVSTRERRFRLVPRSPWMTHLDTWDGPPDFTVCTDAAAARTDANAAAIQGMEAQNPLRRPGCCG